MQNDVSGVMCVEDSSLMRLYSKLACIYFYVTRNGSSSNSNTSQQSNT